MWWQGAQEHWSAGAGVMLVEGTKKRYSREALVARPFAKALCGVNLREDGHTYWP